MFRKLKDVEDSASKNANVSAWLESFTSDPRPTKASDVVAAWEGILDCYGRPMAVLKAQELLRDYDKIVMKKDIAWRMAIGVEKGTVKKTRFHVLDVQTWVNTTVKTVEGDIEDLVVPAELGLVEITLEDGVDRVFHQLVDPGKLPVGVKGEMKLHSDRIHRIWLNQEDLGNDYVGIVNAIAEMLTPRPEETPAGKGVTVSGYEDLLKSYRRGGNEGQKFLPLYVMPKNSDKCQKAIKWLLQKAKVDYQFCYYELPQLFIKLLDASGAPLGVPSVAIAEATLSREVFLYTPGVNCRYHHSIECYHCAAGNALRQALLFLDVCVQVCGGRPVEGKHLPWNVNPEQAVPKKARTKRGESPKEGIPFASTNDSSASGYNTASGYNSASDRAMSLVLEKLRVAALSASSCSLDLSGESALKDCREQRKLEGYHPEMSGTDATADSASISTAFETPQASDFDIASEDECKGVSRRSLHRMRLLRNM